MVIENGFCGKKCRFNFTAANEKDAKRGLARLLQEKVRYEVIGFRPVNAIAVPIEYAEGNETIFTIDALLKVPATEENRLRKMIDSIAGFEAVLN